MCWLVVVCFAVSLLELFVVWAIAIGESTRSAALASKIARISIVLCWPPACQQHKATAPVS
jgi:hypothetical protein